MLSAMPRARYDAVADWYEEKFLTTGLARDIAPSRRPPGNEAVSDAFDRR